jgi:hypothetical protein
MFPFRNLGTMVDEDNLNGKYAREFNSKGN